MRSVSELLYNFHWVVPGEAGGMPVADWIGGHYSALAFKSWLEARGEGRAFHLVARGAA